MSDKQKKFYSRPMWEPVIREYSCTSVNVFRPDEEKGWNNVKATFVRTWEQKNKETWLYEIKTDSREVRFANNWEKIVPNTIKLVVTETIDYI